MALKPLDNEPMLLAALSRGDHRAFCTLFDHYHGYVYGFGRKLTRSDDLAEEIVQDIFIKVWNGREELPELTNFGGYLSRLIRNHAYSILRKQLLHTRVHADLAGEGWFSDVDDSLEQQLDYQETRRIMDDAIGQLTEQQRRIYIRCHQQGQKYEEVASELGISADTVHYHIKAALKTIRAHFGKYGMGYAGLFIQLFR